ncbi:HDOD domain-containing protein [Xenophilus arseniciresistens]|uniref:HDOD domain-containing protein n=1 Tax=Xenophilus arseniciresistens TaxID=1283306 RepID=A0AAE3SXR3_9BURK|nr:HDOD domain-containing protein [Xenophilus arseniciresistens]MDA7415262.1 HDOD domain-containing protein [Xenophilus arseniciresistens]
MARRILVDRRRAVAGYRLVGPLKPQASAAAPQALGAPSLPDASAGLAPSRKPNFLSCTGAQLAQMLASPRPPDPGRLVLELQPSPDDGSGNAPFDLAQLQQVRSAGFRLALETRWLREHPALGPLVSHVLLCMRAHTPDELARMALYLRQQGPVKTVALGLRSSHEFERLSDAGVDLFEGMWFSHGEHQHQPPQRGAVAPYASLIQLMNLVRSEAELPEIEALLKREPTLSYRLLRYINTSGFGRHLEISSFRHAVMTVGMKRLFRWTAILLASSPADHVAPAASTVAIVRGRVMELLAAGTMAPVEAELAFVAGTFSMLDVLLGMDLREALSLVSLPAEVSEAVLHGRGVFAPYLLMAKACESGDEALIDLLSQRHGFTRDWTVDAHARALDWAERLD